jgi:hypothetical protein
MGCPIWQRWSRPGEVEIANGRQRVSYLCSSDISYYANAGQQQRPVFGREKVTECRRLECGISEECVETGKFDRLG